MSKLSNRIAIAALSITGIFPLVSTVKAADHGDAPLVSQDQGADIGDNYFFVDPNDPTKVVMAMDVHGFIVPGENANFGNFDPTVRFRFNIENTGDAVPDMAIDVQFSPLVSKTLPQTATIRLSTGQTFTAPTTISNAGSATPPPQTITTDPTTNISFFAGLTDDPFFFDASAFAAFVASVNAGSPNPSVFTRGRDTFAGYNIDMVALEVPISLIRGASTNTKLGFFAQTQRRRVTVLQSTTQPVGSTLGDGAVSTGSLSESGPWHTLDRSGLPALNIVFIPQNMKDEYNFSTPVDDAAGKFEAAIVATAQHFGMDNAHITALANLGVTKGDYLRLDTSIANTGNGGGTNSAAAFPNGRRPADDVIDTLLTLINNGNTLGDNVNANDVPFQNAFPFFALPHQPLPAGSTDDTQN